MRPFFCVCGRHELYNLWSCRRVRTMRGPQLRIPFLSRGPAGMRQRSTKDRFQLVMNVIVYDATIRTHLGHYIAREQYPMPNPCQSFVPNAFSWRTAAATNPCWVSDRLTAASTTSRVFDKRQGKRLRLRRGGREKASDEMRDPPMKEGRRRRVTGSRSTTAVIQSLVAAAACSLVQPPLLKRLLDTHWLA